MNNFSKIIIIALLAVVVLGTSQANAQSMSMPVFYDSDGDAVNASNDGSILPAGTYYRNNNGTGEVYYYGNGRFYDPSTMTYWGSDINFTGASGASITNLTPLYSQTNTQTTTGDSGQNTTLTPGVPNTGAGGQALVNWSIVGLAVLAIGAVTYGITRQRTV